jgi:hypothetical protein
MDLEKKPGDLFLCDRSQGIFILTRSAEILEMRRRVRTREGFHHSRSVSSSGSFGYVICSRMLLGCSCDHIRKKKVSFYVIRFKPLPVYSKIGLEGDRKAAVANATYLNLSKVR